MWARWAETGSPGICNMPVCVMEMELPSGRVTAIGNGDVVKVVGSLEEVACSAGVDNCGGVARRGGGGLCGCNDTPSNFYIISSRHTSGRPSGSGSA
jgi:hypothetical protein